MTAFLTEALIGDQHFSKNLTLKKDKKRAKKFVDGNLLRMQFKGTPKLLINDLLQDEILIKVTNSNPQNANVMKFIICSTLWFFLCFQVHLKLTSQGVFPAPLHAFDVPSHASPMYLAWSDWDPVDRPLQTMPCPIIFAHLRLSQAGPTIAACQLAPQAKQKISPWMHFLIENMEIMIWTFFYLDKITLCWCRSGANHYEMYQ